MKTLFLPEEPLEQERFKRRLIAIARSLKNKHQQLQADQDLLNDRWTNVLAAEEYGSSAQPRVTLSVSCYRNSMTRRWCPYHRCVTQPTDHHVVVTKRQVKPNTSPYYLAVKVETQHLGDIRMTYVRTWTIEQVRTDRSTDHEGVPRRATTAI